MRVQSRPAKRREWFVSELGSFARPACRLIDLACSPQALLCVSLAASHWFLKRAFSSVSFRFSCFDLPDDRGPLRPANLLISARGKRSQGCHFQGLSMLPPRPIYRLRVPEGLASRRSSTRGGAIFCRGRWASQDSPALRRSRRCFSRLVSLW